MVVGGKLGQGVDGDDAGVELADGVGIADLRFAEVGFVLEVAMEHFDLPTVEVGLDEQVDRGGEIGGDEECGLAVSAPSARADRGYGT